MFVRRELDPYVVGVAHIGASSAVGSIDVLRRGLDPCSVGVTNVGASSAVRSIDFCASRARSVFGWDDTYYCIIGCGLA